MERRRSLGVMVIRCTFVMFSFCLLGMGILVSSFWMSCRYFCLLIVVVCSSDDACWKRYAQTQKTPDVCANAPVLPSYLHSLLTHGSVRPAHYPIYSTPSSLLIRFT